MARTPEQITRLGARLEVASSVLQLVLQELPQTLGEGVIERMSAEDHALLAERLALFRVLIETVRGRGHEAATHPPLSREEIGVLYFTAQAAQGHIGQALRKLNALAADTIEDAATTAGQKATWEGRLDGSLAALDTAVAEFPNATDAREE